VEDGGTLQLGIGGIPDAVLQSLMDKKDLGIHTEMVSDGIVKLIEAGIITNSKKTLHPGKIIATFILGSRQLYSFVDNNPLFEVHPCDYTNDPFIVAKNEKLISPDKFVPILSGLKFTACLEGSSILSAVLLIQKAENQLSHFLQQLKMIPFQE
jgi:4-hydroxybutyrate CoA-transferase